MLVPPDVLPAVKTALNAGVVIVGILSSTYFFVAKFKSDVGAIPVTNPVNVAVVVVIAPVESIICVPAPVPVDGFIYKPSLNISFPSANIVIAVWSPVITNALLLP